MRKTIQKRATMKDVAQRAGVTIGTVSHVLNDTAVISRETTLRVRKAMEDLRYIPNSQAQNMRTKKNKLIGLLVPKLTNSFYAQIASVFMNYANQGEYTVLILGYEYSLEQEKKELMSLMQNNVGTILIVNGNNDEEYIEDLLNKGVNVILVDRRMPVKDVSYVEFDNTDVMFDIVKLLKSKNYKTIGFITEPLSLINLSDRFKGYKNALKQYGYPYREEFVFISDTFRLDHTINAYEYTRRLLKSRSKEDLPEVFIASSDQLAIGIMRAIYESGYRIPEDFAIVGCDNLQISGYLQTALTTINQDSEKLAKEMWKLAKGKIEGKVMDNVILKQELIIRETC